MKDLGSMVEALPEGIRDQGNYGKFHVGPHQFNDGSIYFASYPREHWSGPPTGRLFRYDSSRGIVDLGPAPGNQGIYFMYGDDIFNRLYFVGYDSHFHTYDVDTGTWKDKGKFSSKPPFIALTDQQGRVYVYSYDGKGEHVPGPATITRYDPRTDQLETSANAPPTLWVGAVTPDHDVAYTTGYKRAEIYRWRLSDWPDYRTEHLGRIDPKGRAIFSNDLSLTPDLEKLVLAGTIVSRNNWFLGSIHGVWVYDIHSGEKIFAARLNDALTKSFGIKASTFDIYWTNANTVDDEGWIYVGIHLLPSDASSAARLLAIRIHAKGDD
jgi:hypothetical protein